MIIDPNNLPDSEDMYGPDSNKRRGLPLPIIYLLMFFLVLGVAILIEIIVNTFF